MNNQTLGKQLKYQRTLKGFTQEKLAEESTVGIRTIQRIEKEEVTPHLQTINLLADTLGIKVDDLVIIENPNHEKIQRKWMLMIHATQFLGFIIPLGNVLFPLFIWIQKGNDNPIYDNHGKAVINFQGSLLLYIIISLLLFFLIPGYNYFLTVALVLFGIITATLNIRSALGSSTCRYPLSIPFLK
jgi:uncharacterized Tic20 family protein